MRFVRKENEFYYQHPVDRQHALRVLVQRSAHYQIGDPNALLGPIVQREISLNNFRAEAANFFHEIQLPRHEWRTVGNVGAYVSELNLRLELNDDDSAATILNDIGDFLDRRGAFQLKLTLAIALKDKAQSPDSRVEPHWDT